MVPNLRRFAALRLPFPSLRYYQRSLFHSRTDLIQQLQNPKDLQTVISIHCKFLKFGLSADTFTHNHLLNSYLKFHQLGNARRVFDEILEPNVVSWTSLMAGLVNNSRPLEALRLFTRMPCNHTFPNAFTFATAVNACSILAHLDLGRKVHSLIETFGLQLNVVVTSSLIDMYGKCNSPDNARLVFDSMVDRNVISWSSMISVCAQNARGHQALELFREFLHKHYLTLIPNHFTFASVLSACASLGRLVAGRASHGAIIRRGHTKNEVVAIALVDMYAKCGLIDYSYKVFRTIQDPSVIAYTSMIVSAAKHGLGSFSLDLFEEMTKRGIIPNDVTFVGVLYACSHSGLVDVGLRHLNSMRQTYGVAPDVKHYTCVVDMLGRAGRLDEAYDLANQFLLEPNDAALLWGALLSASRTHGRLDLAVAAGKTLIELNQQTAAAYVTMSNTYALAGKWESVYGLRSEMKRRGISKEPGCSWLEIRDATYLFYAGDVSSCPRGAEVTHELKELEVRMRERGYVGVGIRGSVFIDVDEESEEVMVGLHSERLALGFGLISLPKGVTIRVMKNLRMCGNCHDAFKLISDIAEREIVVRDVNRFHHFGGGSCSCGDYW